MSACFSVAQVEAGADVSLTLFTLLLGAVRVGLSCTKNFLSLCRTDSETLSLIIKALTMHGLLHVNWSLSMSVIKCKHTPDDFWKAQVYLLSAQTVWSQGYGELGVLAVLVTEYHTFTQNEFIAIALIFCIQNHLLKLCSYLLAGWSLWGCFKLCLACGLQSWEGEVIMDPPWGTVSSPQASSVQRKAQKS